MMSCTNPGSGIHRVPQEKESILLQLACYWNASRHISAKKLRQILLGEQLFLAD